MLKKLRIAQSCTFSRVILGYFYFLLYSVDMHAHNYNVYKVNIIYTAQAVHVYHNAGMHMA